MLDDLEDRPRPVAKRRRGSAASSAPRAASSAPRAAKTEDLSAQTLRQLLLKRSNWFEDRILRSAPRFGYGFVTPAMHRVFAHMSRKPVSMAELARRLAVSRQAVHQTVAEACRRGILELVEDPSDARVRKVRFTEKGLVMVRSASQSVKTIESDLERRLGPRDFAALRRILSRDW